MFFSANLDYPKKLEAAGLIEPGTFYQYASGKIVIWIPNNSKLDLTSGLQSLLNPAIRKIAIANPQHAPYGQAAVAAMKKEKVYDEVADKLVLGENISQTASFVVSGAADAGIVALSLALSPNMKDKGRYAEIPGADYLPIEQACVILKSSQQKDTAKAFLNFIKTPAVAELFRTYGFDVPSGSTSPIDISKKCKLGHYSATACRFSYQLKVVNSTRTEALQSPDSIPAAAAVPRFLLRSK